MTLTDDEVLTDTCARCGALLDPDQEWCLECGSARTIVHRPPDPRIGAAIVGAITLIVLAAAVIAVILAGQSAGGGTAASSPRSSAATGQATSVTLASWPVGLSGWTVVLGRNPDPVSAAALARRIAAQGLSTGVLDSSQHPHLKPGYYVVFSGRYPDGVAANAAAAALRAKGQPQAVAREVARPGGL